MVIHMDSDPSYPLLGIRAIAIMQLMQSWYPGILLVGSPILIFLPHVYGD